VGVEKRQVLDRKADSDFAAAPDLGGRMKENGESRHSALVYQARLGTPRAGARR
jgi:hypothetical protein